MNNVVGKMLIVMQLVFSVLFMCFAGAVYTFQGQWKAEAESLRGKLENSQKQTNEAKADHARDKMLLSQKVTEAEAERDRITALQAGFEQRANEAEKRVEDLQQEAQKAEAESTVATTEAAARVVESKALNREVESLRKRIAELREQRRTMENELLESQGKLAGAEEMEEQLLAEVANLKDLLRLNGIDHRQKVTPGSVGEQIEKIDGFVKKSLRNDNRTQELVHITIGSDDKIYEDMTLTVFRENKYICQIRVMEVFPDISICVVIEETRNGTIKAGDNVTTKL